ncbi:MAG: DegV family protein [Firmicutes bacterium HGW-Firmicutes-12]|jgi:DegV family protein with EDD domain|nr:MAG: DegV family protein [Firmicutes bacterium HGW-Firmicutes-12]
MNMIKKIKIVTDSTADLPVSLLNEYNISIIPLKVIFKDNIYREGVDITTKEFYEKLLNSEQLPMTSQPSPGEFQELYEELTQDGSTVISIHISAKMSGTCQSAVLAKNSLPDRDIRVIDSEQVTMSLGLIVLAAAKAAKENNTADEIEALAYEVSKRVKLFFIVDTLDNLQKGGRIGKASALIGTVLNIKPILTVEDGIVTPYEKIRGKSKAIERIVGILKEYDNNNKLKFCVILHANALDEAVSLHERVITQINPHENIISDIGAVVGTHAGAGTIGVVFY